ncbi:tetratricopeptide repeat protein [Rosistilla oblonga]|uniref:tetratricopeptide repeat protein n=1 Tax=Rosistilla oblonga TaxID=2527990 RepID=UPI003A969A60
MSFDNLDLDGTSLMARLHGSPLPTAEEMGSPQQRRSTGRAIGLCAPIKCLAFAMLLGLPGIATAQFDQVYPLRGAPMNGEFVGSTPTEVTIKVQGTDRKIAVNEIRRLGFKEDPAELKQARSRVASGDYQAAMDELKKINPASVTRPIILLDLQFYLALCEGKLALSSGGDKGSAASAMLAFVRKASKSHHFFAAAEMLGDLAVALGKYPEAIKYYGAISAQAPWPEYKMHAVMLEARALMAQKDFANAEKKFASLANATASTAETKRQQLLAQVGVARCQAETQSPEAAIAAIQKLVADNDESDAELFGRAYNALGACYLKANKPKEALMAYLHVDVLFYAQPEIHAEALYQLSKLWEQVKKTDRANAARNLLNDRYAGSRWASM